MLQELKHLTAKYQNTVACFPYEGTVEMQKPQNMHTQ
jgi:hypothetical protein